METVEEISARQDPTDLLWWDQRHGMGDEWVWLPNLGLEARDGGWYA